MQLSYSMREKRINIDKEKIDAVRKEGRVTLNSLEHPSKVYVG